MSVLHGRVWVWVWVKLCYALDSNLCFCMLMSTSTFIVVLCSLLSHLACPVVLTDSMLYLVLQEKCAAGLGALRDTIFTEWVMGTDGDRLELKPCNQTAALPCYPESRWVLGAEWGYELWTMCRLVLVLFGSLASLGLNKCSHLSLANFARIVELLFSTALLYRCGGSWFVSWLCFCLHLVHWNRVVLLGFQ